jgi:hypothetical protein
MMKFQLFRVQNEKAVLQNHNLMLNETIIIRITLLHLVLSQFPAIDGEQLSVKLAWKELPVVLLSIKSTQRVQKTVILIN